MKYLQYTSLSLMFLVVFTGCSLFRGGSDETAAEPDVSVAEPRAAAAETATGNLAPPAVPTQTTPVSSPGSGESYVLSELNFEIKKLGAEVQRLTSELRDLQAKSAMLINPLSIYDKEIILENGTTILGKIVYQDEAILKVETLIGFLSIDRTTVVRIVENIPASPVSGGGVLGSARSQGANSPVPANRVVEPSFVTSQPAAPTGIAARAAFAPNIVLMGAINESRDRSGNLKLFGEVKNIGGRRADFVKINFVFRKDWSGNTKTFTSFVSGSLHSFESGINSESSVLPGATAIIELYVPQSFGTYIGYSYTIDWETY